MITTPFTFFATGEMISLLGAVPVFVDIDPATLHMDIASIEAAITPRSRAIMPVSLYGLCSDMVAIEAVAARHGLAVIEDGAQASAQRATATARVHAARSPARASFRPSRWAATAMAVPVSPTTICSLPCCVSCAFTGSASATNTHESV
ncbi:MAG: DegT/DnrJ/EryC1/StrS family aminotransferase [Burkholderiaceae bacterium]